MAQENNGQNRTDLLHTANLLRGARPKLSALRLDEIKHDVLRSQARSAGQVKMPLRIRRRLLGFSLFTALFAISSSTAAAQALNWISGGTLGKTVGVGKTQGTSFFFGSFHVGGDSSDNAGNNTYCHQDNGSDSSDKGSDEKSSSKSSSSKTTGKSTGKTTVSSGRTITTHTGTNGGSDSSDKNTCQNGSDSSDGHSSRVSKSGNSSYSGKDDKSGKGGKDEKSGGSKSSGKGGH